jgi:hypothetical protein
MVNGDPILSYPTVVEIYTDDVCDLMTFVFQVNTASLSLIMSGRVGDKRQQRRQRQQLWFRSSRRSDSSAATSSTRPSAMSTSIASPLANSALTAEVPFAPPLPPLPKPLVHPRETTTAAFVTTPTMINTTRVRSLAVGNMLSPCSSVDSEGVVDIRRVLDDDYNLHIFMDDEGDVFYDQAPCWRSNDGRRSFPLISESQSSKNFQRTRATTSSTNVTAATAASSTASSGLWPSSDSLSSLPVQTKPTLFADADVARVLTLGGERSKLSAPDRHAHHSHFDDLIHLHNLHHLQHHNNEHQTVASWEYQGISEMWQSLSNTEKSQVLENLDDTMLIRHFRGEKGNSKKALESIRRTLKWRQDFGVNEMVRVMMNKDENQTVTPTATDWRGIFAIEAAVPKMYVRGYDQDGRALVYMRPAVQNTHDELNNMRHVRQSCMFASFQPY